MLEGARIGKKGRLYSFSTLIVLIPAQQTDRRLPFSPYQVPIRLNIILLVTSILSSSKHYFLLLRSTNQCNNKTPQPCLLLSQTPHLLSPSLHYSSSGSLYASPHPLCVGYPLQTHCPREIYSLMASSTPFLTIRSLTLQRQAEPSLLMAFQPSSLLSKTFILRTTMPLHHQEVSSHPLPYHPTRISKTLPRARSLTLQRLESSPSPTIIRTSRLSSETELRRALVWWRRQFVLPHSLLR